MLVIFGWSAKCGCSYIKTLIVYLNKFELLDNNVHRILLPYITKPDEFECICFIRNPYIRLVSGFRDKLREEYFSELFNKGGLDCTFKNYVDVLLNDNKEYNMIDKHHFEPQIDDLTKDLKKIKMFDINNIDFNYIQNLLNETIPDELINTKIHNYNLNFNVKQEITEYVYDKHINDIHEYKINYSLFYNEEIKNKVYKYYESDFIYFKQNGFDYDI